MWSFFWSSSQVLVHLVGICSFLVLVCRERMWFLELESMYSLTGVFQFDIFFSVFLNSSMCISVLGPFSCPSSSLVILFIHSAFRYAFSVDIFSSKVVRFLWRLVVGMFLSHALPVDRIFFRCFGMSCFVYCFTLCRYLFNLPSFARTFWFISSSCTVIFLVLSFAFCSHIFQDISVLPFWPVFVNFFIYVSSWISHPGFDCFFVLFEGTSVFSHTNFAPA